LTAVTVVEQPPPGPHRAVPATAPRAPGSVRRTTTIDITRPEGLTGPVVAVLAGQDLATAADGRASVLRRTAFSLGIDQRTGAVTTVAAGSPAGGAVDRDAHDPDLGPDAVDRGPDHGAEPGVEPAAEPGVELGVDGLDELVGSSVRSGFGRRLAALLATDAAARSLRYSLLEDLPGALLVSGFAPLRAGLLAGNVELAKKSGRAQADICAGWATGSPVHVALAEHGHTAVPRGPSAPVLERVDPLGWHPLDALGVETVRRRRQLDVVRDPGGGLRVQAHFRDSHAGEEREMVMHEYAVEAAFGDDDRVSRVEVDPRVLPWAECPAATASAGRVVGVGLDDLARYARAELVGPSTCTHLTSTIRSLVDVQALVASIPPARG
jgi:hypothetical protein